MIWHLTVWASLHLLLSEWIFLGYDLTTIQENGEHGCGMLWSTLGQVKQQGLLYILLWMMSLESVVVTIMDDDHIKLKILLVSIVVCIRFCAFFSLTMVLVSTVTFIISTIDELQMNDEGEVRLFFVVSTASFSFNWLNVRWSTLCCSIALRSSTSSQSTSSPLSAIIFTRI